jgi:hypothetical protein
MTGSSSSANPAALYQYADTATRINTSLANVAGQLRSALGAFTASCSEYNAGAGTELADQLRARVAQWAPTDEWVRTVGADFAQADARGVGVSPHLPEKFGTWVTAGGQVLPPEIGLGQGERPPPPGQPIPPAQPQQPGQRERFPRGGKVPWGLVASRAWQEARNEALPKGILGKGFLLTSIAYSGWGHWEAYAGDEDRVVKTAAATAFDTAVKVGINVATTGALAAVGGAFGALGGPVGIAVGARIGGAAGSMLGGWLGDQAVKSDVVTEVRDDFVDAVSGWFSD